jgi:uncharacterized protein YjbI with pentapeptide repeats
MGGMKWRDEMRRMMVGMWVFAIVMGLSYGKVMGYFERDLIKLQQTHSCAYCTLDCVHLYGIDLTNADLRGANLSDAIVNQSNLTGANLSGANLTSMGMFETNLTGANLTGATAIHAILDRANLTNANLSGAIVTGASITQANLSNANLSGADLRGTDLRDSNLSGAVLSHANLGGTLLEGATWTDGSKCKEGSVGKCIK